MSKPRTWKEAYIALLPEYDELKSENGKLKAKRRIEFSKLIIFGVMLTYFVGLFFGMYAVNKILTDYPEYAIQALIALFGYVGAPISVAIGFYSWKAKNENVPKIERGIAQSQDDEQD